MAGYFSIGEVKTVLVHFSMYRRTEMKQILERLMELWQFFLDLQLEYWEKLQFFRLPKDIQALLASGRDNRHIKRSTLWGRCKLIAVRVGNGGTIGSASLACTTGKLKISTKYPSAAKFTATIRAKLGDSSKKECIVYLVTLNLRK